MATAGHLELNAPQSMVNLSYRAIMPQDGLSGNIALHSLTRFSANKRRKLVITPVSTLRQPTETQG
jgi:hypothetical protein